MSAVTPPLASPSSPTQARRRAGRSGWSRRLLPRLVAALLALGGLGAAYQAVAAALDQRAFPPPGQMIDVGGYRLHLVCQGAGSPTVILETGGGGFGALDWTLAQRELAAHTRVCAYDRAGYGWSDPSPHPRTGRQIVAELHALLANAGVEGPYVLAGQSLGGLFARLYASEHPGEVAGLALIDASHEDQWTDPELRAATDQFGLFLKVCARGAADLGLWRLAGETGLFPYPILAFFPPDLQRLARPMTYRPEYCRMVAAEISLASLDETAAQVRAARRPLGDLPLAVLSAGAGHDTDQARATWLAFQRDLATLSTAVRHRVLPEATHLGFATTDAPASAAAILEVVEAVRARTAR